MVKNLSVMWETQVRSLGQEDHLAKGMAIILAWKIPWSEEPGKLQSMGLQRVGQDWAINSYFCLLSCACVLSRFSRVLLFATLWTVTRQASVSMEFSRQEFWSGFPCPPLGDLPDPGIEPTSPVALALQVDSLPLSHQGSPLLRCSYLYMTVMCP